MKYAHVEAGSIYEMAFFGYDSKGIPMYLGDGRYWRCGITNSDEIQFYIKNGFARYDTRAGWQLIKHSNGVHLPFYDSLSVLLTIVTGKQIGRASCRERVSSPV